MKYRVITDKKISYVKSITKEVIDYYKALGLKIEFDIEKSKIDWSNNIFYETTYSWSFLKRTPTKSLKTAVVSIFKTKEYDGAVMFLDDKNTPQEATLRGQHTGDGLIEIYSKDEYIKKQTRKGITRYKNTRRKTNLKRDTYVLIHEIGHHLEHLTKTKGLHEEIEKDNFDGFIKQLVELYKPPVVKGLLPKIKRDLERFIELANQAGFNLRITSGYRSFEEQDELYAQGRTKPGRIVTNAKGGESHHNYGIAFDIVDRFKGYNLTKKEWATLAILWHKIGGKHTGWGGLWKSFVDKPHYYNNMGYSLKDFQKGNVDYAKFK